MNNTIAAAAQAAASKPEKCELLGPFAILVQGALGALALLSLVYKRWRERPQRPIKVWAFDASKQVFGSVLLHLANLLMSMFSAGEIQASIARAAAASVASAGGGQDGGSSTSDAPYRPNPCSFYLLNIAIDTTLGIPILILILKIFTVGVTKTGLVQPPESIQSGNYGSPPRVSWWLKQSVIYSAGLVCMKICVLLIFELCPWIIVVGDWALKWTEGNAAVQITFVMFIFPLIMNAIQYYIIDTFIKHKQPDVESDDHDGHDHNVGEEERFLADGEEQGRDGSVDEERTAKKASRDHVTKYFKRTITPYDPVKDGEVEQDLSESSRNGSASVQGQSPRARSHSRER